MYNDKLVYKVAIWVFWELFYRNSSVIPVSYTPHALMNDISCLVYTRSFQFLVWVYFIFFNIFFI